MKCMTHAVVPYRYACPGTSGEKQKCERPSRSKKSWSQSVTKRLRSQRSCKSRVLLNMRHFTRVLNCLDNLVSFDLVMSVSVLCVSVCPMCETNVCTLSQSLIGSGTYWLYSTFCYLDCVWEAHLLSSGTCKIFSPSSHSSVTFTAGIFENLFWTRRDHIFTSFYFPSHHPPFTTLSRSTVQGC